MRSFSILSFVTPLAFLSVIGCNSSRSTNHATGSDNCGVQSDRERAVASVVAVGELEQLTPELVARALGSQITSTVPGDRREYRLAPTALFASIECIDEVIDNGPWRVVTLRPTAALDLALEDFVPHLLEARYAMDVRMVHHGDSIAPVPDAVNHRFAVRAGELVVTVRRGFGGGSLRGELDHAYRSGIDQATDDARHDVVESIIVTTTKRIPPGAMTTLREFRQWAATHP